MRELSLKKNKTQSTEINWILEMNIATFCDDNVIFDGGEQKFEPK